MKDDWEVISIERRKALEAVAICAAQLRRTLNSQLTQYTGDIFNHFRALGKKLVALKETE